MIGGHRPGRRERGAILAIDLGIIVVGSLAVVTPMFEGYMKPIMAITVVEALWDLATTFGLEWLRRHLWESLITAVYVLLAALAGTLLAFIFWSRGQHIPIVNLLFAGGCVFSVVWMTIKWLIFVHDNRRDAPTSQL